MDQPDQITAYVEYALAAIGAASVVAGVLRSFLPRLRAYAERTATTADNALVEAASIGLSLLTMAIEAVHAVANELALNPRKPKPPTKEEPAP